MAAKKQSQLTVRYLNSGVNAYSVISDDLTIRSIGGVRPISVLPVLDTIAGGITNLHITFDKSLTRLTNYCTKQEINNFAGLNNYYNKNESNSGFQGAFKQSASSWNGNCIYDNLRISVQDAHDGKRLWLSAASASPFNGL